MILNSGLDQACSVDGSSYTGAPYPYFCQFINYACFGTGSATPAASDTSLGSQAGSRTTSNGGFASSTSQGVDDTEDVVWYESTYTRVFSIGGNVNATEWGLAYASTGNLSVRELFRADPLDNSSSPVTLTLESGDELQLVITLRVEATWEYETKSFTITGAPGNDSAGTYEGKATVSSGSATTELAIRNALLAVWPGGTGGQHTCVQITSDSSTVAKGANFASSDAAPTVVAASYATGTYYRDTTATFSTSTGNGDHYAWNVGVAQQNSGFRFVLDDPAKLTKASTHKLTLTLRRSIARL